MPPTLIDDIKTAVDNYPEDDVDVTITDFEILPGSGTVLNTGDKAKFKVSVANNGELDMLNTTVRVSGTSFADVSTVEAGPFANAVTVSLGTISANGTKKTNSLFLKAKATTAGSQTIVEARLDGWDASLDHILKAHSTAGPNEGKLTKTIAAA